MFQNVIVKTPCKAMVNGLTAHPQLGGPNYEKALQQHKAYQEALVQCGVELTVLPADEAYPDSCFIEDIAVLTKYCAIIANPATASRNPEIEAIKPILLQFYPQDKIYEITAPGTLEGGDVMMCGDTFFVGMSARTNEQGFHQFCAILAKFGCRAVAVPLNEVLHLKTGVAYLENNTILAAGEFCDKMQLKGYQQIVVPPEEAYAANSIWVNGTVLVPAGYPIVEGKLRDAGYPVLVCDTSEFRKLDGGLSCLSLRF